MSAAANGWYGAAIGAAAALAIGIGLAIAANLAIVLGVRGAGFSIAAAIGVLLYGSLGVSSVGSSGVSVDEFSTNVHYSISLTLLGGFLVMLAALAYAGWLGSRHGEPADRGSVRTGIKAAVLFAAAMFLGSFVVSYVGMHPQHLEALAFPLLFALLAAPVGSRIERDGPGFWRAPIHALGSSRPEVVQALGSGFDALVRALKWSACGLLVALGLLAVTHAHDAVQLVAGRQIFALVLLLPLYLPHLVGLMFVASQGIAFRVGLTGVAGLADSLTGGHAHATASIFGAGRGVHVPFYFRAAVLIPLATALWGGHLAARRRGGAIRDRLVAAAIASTPFVLFTWIVSALIGISVDAGGAPVGSGGIGFGTVPGDAILWPLLWGPVVFVGGALLQIWRAGDLDAVSESIRARAEAVAAAAAPAQPAPAIANGAPVLVEQPSPHPGFCTGCGALRSPDKRFCTFCGHANDAAR